MGRECRTRVWVLRQRESELRLDPSLNPGCVWSRRNDPQVLKLALIGVGVMQEVAAAAVVLDTDDIARDQGADALVTAMNEAWVQLGAKIAPAKSQT